MEAHANSPSETEKLRHALDAERVARSVLEDDFYQLQKKLYEQSESIGRYQCIIQQMQTKLDDQDLNHHEEIAQKDARIKDLEAQIEALTTKPESEYDPIMADAAAKFVRKCLELDVNAGLNTAEYAKAAKYNLEAVKERDAQITELEQHIKNLTDQLDRERASSKIVSDGYSKAHIALCQSRKEKDAQIAELKRRIKDLDSQVQREKARTKKCLEDLVRVDLNYAFTLRKDGGKDNGAGI